MSTTYIYDREPKPSRGYDNDKRRTRGFIKRRLKLSDNDFRKNTGAVAKRYVAELKRRKIKYTHDIALLSEIRADIPGRDVRSNDEFVHVFEF